MWFGEQAYPMFDGSLVGGAASSNGQGRLFRVN